MVSNQVSRYTMKIVVLVERCLGILTKSMAYLAASREQEKTLQKACLQSGRSLSVA